MVITGATGGIGKELMSFYKAVSYDPRIDDPPDTTTLINCMGVNTDSLSHEYISSYPISINLSWTLHVISRVLPYMRERGYGRIINMSSILSEGSVVGTAAYTASKAGINAAIRVIAKENAKHNVLINNLNLGYFNMGMTHKINNYEDLQKQIPVGRFGEIDEIIRAIEFLRNSSYITGTTINISGGLW